MTQRLAPPRPEVVAAQWSALKDEVTDLLRRAGMVPADATPTIDELLALLRSTRCPPTSTSSVSSQP